MTEEAKKNLSRRDALKILGAAAGATVLANLPAKWDTPELAAGVLPAHAQTSACWAVFAEVLSCDDGIFEWFVAEGPDPDLMTGDGGPGSTLGWNCQSGCLFFFQIYLGNGTGSVRITTMAGSFIENFDSDNWERPIAVEMGTGAYTNNFDPAGDCEWPPEPEAVLQKDGSDARKEYFAQNGRWT